MVKIIDTSLLLIKASVMFLVLKPSNMQDKITIHTYGMYRLIGIQNVIDSKDLNTVMSPLGARLPLHFLIFGTRSIIENELVYNWGYILQGYLNPTDAEFVHVICHGCMEVAIADANRIKTSFSTANDVNITFTNRAYITKHVDPKFEGYRKRVVNSSLEIVDFKQGLTLVTKINNWMKHSNLANAIEISDAPLDPSVIIVNLINFRGAWKYSFEPEPYKLLFKSTNGDIKVPHMSLTATLRYSYLQRCKTQVIEVQYGEFDDNLMSARNASFLLFLPDDGQYYPLLECIKNVNFSSELTFEPKFILLKLPKFRMVMKNDLGKLYRRHRYIKKVLDPEFSQYMNTFVSNKNLYVYGAIQDVDFEINESGTNMESSGAALSPRKTLSGEVTEIVANRPFLFMVVMQGHPFYYGSYTGLHSKNS